MKPTADPLRDALSKIAYLRSPGLIPKLVPGSLLEQIETIALDALTSSPTAEGVQLPAGGYGNGCLSSTHPAATASASSPPAARGVVTDDVVRAAMDAYYASFQCGAERDVFYDEGTRKIAMRNAIEAALRTRTASAKPDSGEAFAMAWRGACVQVLESEESADMTTIECVNLIERLANESFHAKPDSGASAGDQAVAVACSGVDETKPRPTISQLEAICEFRYEYDPVDGADLIDPYHDIIASGLSLEDAQMFVDMLNTNTEALAASQRREEHASKAYVDLVNENLRLTDKAELLQARLDAAEKALRGARNWILTHRDCQTGSLMVEHIDAALTPTVSADEKGEKE